MKPLFGDTGENYHGALDRHYANGPRADWQEPFISTSASAHPFFMDSRVGKQLALVDEFISRFQSRTRAWAEH